MAGGSSTGKDLSMNLKRKLPTMAVLAVLATVAFVVVTASANNREGKWKTVGAKAADVYGVQNLTHGLEFSVEGIVSTPIYCETSQWDSKTSEEETEFLHIIPTLDKCKTTSAGGVTIAVNACSLNLYVAKGSTEVTEQTADIDCLAGVPMEIVDGLCKITIDDQNELTGITYKPIEKNEKITASFNVKLAISTDGTCVKGITGAKLSGALIFEAFDTAAKQAVPLQLK